MATCIDLFAGVGGLSLGFNSVGFETVAAFEIDKWAAQTYSHNHGNTKLFTADITEIDTSFFKKFSGIDVVMGGPPCQGFSIAASNRRNLNDPRNQLYLHFLRAVEAIKPKTVLVENVKEIMTAKLPNGESILSDFIRKLEGLGYTCNYTLVNASLLGVPQERVRFFMIANRLGEIDLKKSLARKTNGSTKRWSITDAISDLPMALKSTPANELESVEYITKNKNSYQKKMRGNGSSVFNHIAMRHSERMIERFKLISVGTSMDSIPSEHSARARGNSTQLSGKIFHQNHRRLDPDKPCRTITASFYSSFIHPFENRNLTVREAARIQSFPDKFRFFGKRTTLSNKLLAKKGVHEDIHLDQFNQVGNAVPPIVAETLADIIKKGL